MTLTTADLRACFPPGLPLYAADATYAVPTSAWLKDRFYPWFWHFRTALGLRIYSRRNDCDNFARACACAAEDCHALTPAASDPAATQAEALAVGEFWYVRANGQAHAICTAVVDAGRLIFFEPQNGDLLTLTLDEINSCTFARF